MIEWEGKGEDGGGGRGGMSVSIQTGSFKPYRDENLMRLAHGISHDVTFRVCMF